MSDFAQQMSAPYIDELSEEENALLVSTFDVWTKRLRRNKKRKAYYDSKIRVKDFKISVPPQLSNAEIRVGWPAKAVDYLANRSMFEGFVFEDAVEESATDVNAILRDNDFLNAYSRGVTSELTHSCAFITVSAGEKGEPDVLVSIYSAENAAALWDYRKKRIKRGMTIVDVDNKKNVKAFNYYTDDAVYIVTRDSEKKWHIDETVETHIGRPLIEPLVYKASVDRPFGRSRITRSVMSITDNAIRSALRTEVAAEFFTSPQKYLLGADEDIFANTNRWDAYIGAILAIGKDADGDTPTVGQFSQMSMQPHIEYMRSLAAQFAGETSIPVSSLGVIHDNPSSAEAIYAAKEDLIIEAQNLNKSNGHALVNVAKMIMAIDQGKSIDELTENEKTVSANFRSPAIPSVVSQSDAMVKQISVLPFLAQSDVALEELGYDKTQIDRIKSARTSVQAQQTLAALVGNSVTGNEDTNNAGAV